MFWRIPVGLDSSLEACSALGEEGNKSDFDGYQGFGQARGLAEGPLQQQQEVKPQQSREAGVYKRVFHKWGAPGAEGTSSSVCIQSPACGGAAGVWLGGCESRRKLCCGVAEGAPAGKPAMAMGWVLLVPVPRPRLAWSRAADHAFAGFLSLPSPATLAQTIGSTTASPAAPPGVLSASDPSHPPLIFLDQMCQIQAGEGELRW